MLHFFHKGFLSPNFKRGSAPDMQKFRMHQFRYVFAEIWDINRHQCARFTSFLSAFSFFFAEPQTNSLRDRHLQWRQWIFQTSVRWSRCMKGMKQPQVSQVPDSCFVCGPLPAWPTETTHETKDPPFQHFMVTQLQPFVGETWTWYHIVIRKPCKSKTFKGIVPGIVDYKSLLKQLSFWKCIHDHDILTNMTCASSGFCSALHTFPTWIPCLVGNPLHFQELQNSGLQKHQVLMQPKVVWKKSQLMALSWKTQNRLHHPRLICFTKLTGIINVNSWSLPRQVTMWH